MKNNCLRTLENSQRFTAMKQAMNEEKGNFKTVGKLCGVVTRPYLKPSLAWQEL